MNNIKKSFERKAAHGLSRAFEFGGVLDDQNDPYAKMSRLEVGQYTNDPTILNAAMDRDAAKAESETRGVRGLNGDYSKYSGGPTVEVANPFEQLGRAVAPALTTTLKQKPGQSAQQLETTFQQDIDARQKRMGGLRQSLSGFDEHRILGAQNGFFNFGKKPVAAPETDPRLKQLEESAALRKSMPGYSAAPAPAAAPAAAPAPTLSQGGGIMSLPGRRTELIDKVSGYKHGGVPHTDERGVIVDPSGAPGEVDETPAKVVANNGHKTDILVTPGERIVNKKQNAALEQLTQAHGVSLDDYLEKATGEPVGPTMKKGLRAANGGLPPQTAEEAWAMHQQRAAAAKAAQTAAAQTAERVGMNAAAAAGDIANTEAAAARSGTSWLRPRPFGWTPQTLKRPRWKL